MVKIKFVLVIVLAAALGFTAEAEAISKKAMLAEKLYLQGNYQSSAYECERLFREYSSRDFRADVAYLAALSYVKLKSHAKAKEFFYYVLNNSNDPALLSEAQIGLENITKESSSVKPPDHYAVQVGSFKDRRNAARLFNKFKRRKYTVRITEDRDGSVTIYKVKIGRFDTREATVRFAAKLRKTGYQTAIVPY